jgi:hypothetical protein
MPANGAPERFIGVDAPQILELEQSDPPHEPRQAWLLRLDKGFFQNAVDGFGLAAKGAEPPSVGCAREAFDRIGRLLLAGIKIELPPGIPGVPG